MSDLKSLANAPLAEIDRLQAEVKHIYLQFERSQACEAKLKQVVQNYVDSVNFSRGHVTATYNAMRDALDFCSNYDTNHKPKK